MKLFVNFRSRSSPNSANGCYQTERQIHQNTWVSARIARASQQCLHENCPQMLEKVQWPPNNSPNFNGMEILYLSSDA